MQVSGLNLMRSLTILLIWSSQVPAPIGAGEAELIVQGGQIVTVDPAFRIAEAMAIGAGRVIAVGDRTEVRRHLGSKTRVLDLQGQMVLPGLIDSHVHPTGAAQFEADHEIPAMDSIQAVLDYVRARTQVVPKGEWIIVSQVFITRLREQRFPTRSELDGVAPDHPVSFRTGPDGSANSLALRENGIDRQFAARHPDNVMVDPESGEPTGVLRNLSAIFKTRSNPSAKKLSEKQQDQRLVQLFEDYNRWGITGIIDRNCSDSARNQYARLLDSGRLSIRLAMSRSLSPNAPFDQIQQRLDSIAADPLFQQRQPRLWILGVKVFADGGMLTGSAYFRQPWGVSAIYGIDDPRYQGMRYVDQQRLVELIRACVQRNLAFTAHCQGDGAVEALIDAYATVNATHPIATTHSTLTHSSFMSPRSIALAAQLGVGVDLQPAWLYLDARTLVSHFGDERMEYFIPLQSLFRAGVKAGGGSDHMQKIGALRSVNPYHPFLGMWVSATRSARWHESPVHLEQALNRQQMIQFYTINNAWLMRAEDQIGSLEVGKRADFIVIDRDLLTCSDAEIRETRVLSTWLDGRQVFSAEAGE